MTISNIPGLIRSDGADNPTKVCSVRIYRCALLDEMSGIKPEGGQITIPFDIDDLDANASVLDSKDITDGDSALKAVRGVAAKNPLNWMGFTDTKKYLSDLSKFSKALKKEYTIKCGKAFGGKTEEEILKSIRVADITSMCSIKSMSRDIQFNNSVVLTVSVQEINADSGLFMPRENDVVEIIMGYPDGTKNREFIGLVGGVSFSENYGDLRSINLTCFGISKILLTNRMVTERAVISQFENGELAQTGLTPWSTNAFANNTADEIFTRIMISQLGLKAVAAGSVATTPQSVLFSIELSTIQEKLSQIVAQIVTLRKETEEKDDKGVMKRDSKAADNIVFEQIGEKNEIKTPATVYADLYSSQNVGLTTIEDGLIKAMDYIYSGGVIRVDNNKAKDFQNNRGQLDNIMTHLLLKSLYEARQTVLNANITREKEAELANLKKTGKSANPKFIIPFVFDQSVFTDQTAFQTVYIPLITLAFVRMGAFNKARTSAQDFEYKDIIGATGDDVIARFTGRRAFAFETMFRSAYELNFSQIETSNQVLEGIRNNAKIYVYENERNQIVAETPRYNEFTNDVGESIEEFIIENPSSVEVVRQDMSMVTRIDTKMYYPFTGVFNFVFLSRHFTDPAVLAKYGMRADAPVFNPNARNELTTTIFSSLELATRNALTRGMEVTVAADRPYRLGRLYFVHRTALEKSMIKFSGGDVSAMPVGGEAGNPTNNYTSVSAQPADGYVGFLTSYSTEISYGAPISHHLSFDFVRRAQLISKKDENGRNIYLANFKILPDISGLIDMMETAYQAGKIDPKSGESKPKYVRKEEIPDHVSTAEGEVYTTDYVGDRSVNKRAGRISVPGNIWFTLRHSHHINLPPNNEGNKSIAVFGMDSVQAGVKRGLMETMHLVDLRLRPLSSSILYNELSVDTFGFDKGRVYYKTVDAYGQVYSGVGQRSPYASSLRNDLFDPIFIPTDQKSPRFVLSNFMGMNMQLFDIDKSSNTDAAYYATMPNMEKMTKDSGTKEISPKFRFVIASETPVRVASKDWDKEKFVILAVISAGEWFRRLGMDREGIITEAVLASDMYKIPQIGTPPHAALNFNTLNGGVKPTYLGPGIEPPGWNPEIKLYNLEVLKNFREVLKSMVPGSVRSKVDAAIDSVAGTYSGEVLFPAVIKAPSGFNRTKMLDCMQPGTPLSTYDLAQLAQPPFETVFPVDLDSGPVAHSHADGRAIDMNFVPYYLNSGWVFKPGVAVNLMGKTYSGDLHRNAPISIQKVFIDGTYGGQDIVNLKIVGLPNFDGMYKKTPLAINDGLLSTVIKTEESKAKIKSMIANAGVPLNIEDIPEEETMFHCEAGKTTTVAVVPNINSGNTMAEGG